MSNRRLKQLEATIRDEVELLVRIGEPEERCVEIIRSRHADLIDELRWAPPPEGGEGMPEQGPLLPDDVDLSVTVASGPDEKLVCVHIRVGRGEELVQLRMTSDEAENFADGVMSAVRFLRSGRPA